MAVGRISGPLLKENLTRDGVDLAFENDLLYLDVNNLRVGIKTSSPTHDLTVNGTTRTSTLEVTSQSNLGPYVSVSGNTIASSISTLNLTPASNGVVYQTKLTVDDIDIQSNDISTNNGNKDLEFRPNGTGSVKVYADTNVQGNIYASGNITADGDIQIGNADTDSITFNADVASNINPNITDFYDLGSSSKRWNSVWTNNFIATTVTAGSIVVDGVDIASLQGNIIYVAANGRDTNAGLHENDPFASVEKALSIASAGDTVYIYPGTYQEALPLTVPAGVTVKGADVRNVIIEPDTSGTHEDVFLLNGETTIEDLTIRGHYYNAGLNKGHAFRFAPNFIITTRSPYVRNVSVITYGSVTSTLDPRGYDQHDAGRGAYLDGSVANASSKPHGASFLFNSVTFICPGVDTIVMTNGVRVEWLNCFTYFANRGLYAFDGTTGVAGAGRTRLKVGNVTGTYLAGQTISYYDEDHTTLLASGTISSIDGDYIYINGKSSGFAEYTERVGKNVTANGNAKISNLQSKFGGYSLALDGTGDYLTVASNLDFAFGTGDFCVELWVYRTGGSGSIQVLTDFRTTNPQIIPTLYLSATNYYPSLTVNGATVISGTSSVALNTWTHIALAKSGSNTKIFLNGTQTGSTYSDTNNYIQSPVTIGARFDGTTPFYGYIDDFRISKDTPRYTTTFSAPTSAFTSDSYTSLLLHFDGINNSTTFVDDIPLTQDIRFSGGATATFITLADYADFGAEVRAMGSASVYGDYGVYGDGPGVIMYLTSQNFGYIGSGKSLENDPLTAIQPNEVVELNNAKIYYTSVDHKGDFRVGDLFFVDQSNGAVQFSNTSINIVGPNGITLVDGGNETIISPSQVYTGNIQISGNTIQSLINEVNITAANNQINLQDNVNVTGDLIVVGNVSIGGNITIGDNSTDSISFVGGIDSSLIPRVGATYDLGSSSLQWKDLYIRVAHISDIEINTNYIRTTVSNANLELRANGTGAILVEDIIVNQNVISTASGNIQITPATTLDITASTTNVTGSLHTTGDVTIDGNTTLGNAPADTVTFNARVNSGIVPTTPATYDLGSSTLAWKTSYLASAFIDNISIDTNIIQTTVSNSNLELRANGTGAVRIEQIDINENVIKTNGSTNLEIRPATTLDIYSDTNINGNLAVTGDVTIGGNITVGNQDTDNISFVADVNSDIIPKLPVTYNLGSASKRWNTVYAGVAEISDIEINTNYIRTTVSNADLELRANGTGGIKLEDVTVNQNVISVASGTNLILQPSGTGIVDVNSTQAIRLPRGTTLQQPASPLAGMIRYNTSNNNYEGYDGTYWRVLNGLYDVDQNTYLVAESTPGANDNTFYFYANGSQIADLNATRLNAIRVEVDNVYIDGSTVGTTGSNNLNLTAAGTGKVKVENFEFKNGTITNSVANSITTISQTGTGYFKIDGTTGFVMPIGTGNQRPLVPETGFMRFNTDDGRVEVYDGTSWASAAGTSSGITVAEAEAISILSVMILG